MQQAKAQTNECHKAAKTRDVTLEKEVGDGRKKWVDTGQCSLSEKSKREKENDTKNKAINNFQCGLMHRSLT